MNEKLKNLKVEEIKFISTNTFFNDRFNVEIKPKNLRK